MTITLDANVNAVQPPAEAVKKFLEPLKNGSEDFFQAVETRRTNYALSPHSTLSDEALKALVERAVKHSPGPYNWQAGRAILLTGTEHTAVWDAVVEAYDNDPEQRYKADKMFKPGYGTILFFEDQARSDAVADQMGLPVPVRGIFRDNAAGMLQYIVWTALAAEGIAASLQHSGLMPAVQKKLQEKFNLPNTWMSTALMPFGVPVGPPGRADHPKTFEPIEERVKAYFGQSTATNSQ